jgi:hypothetical protein
LEPIDEEGHLAQEEIAPRADENRHTTETSSQGGGTDLQVLFEEARRTYDVLLRDGMIKPSRDRKPL